MEKTASEAIEIKEVEEADYPGLYQLDTQLYGRKRYARFFLRQAIEAFRETFLVAKDGKNRVIGYVVAIISQVDPNEAWVLSMAVVNPFRGQGIGCSLLHDIIPLLQKKGIKRIFVTVSPKNQPAIKLYEKTGFRKIKLNKNYFGEGYARIIMQKNLGS
jgi:ribosomal protein S18 acetylase RimI-like enzyme